MQELNINCCHQKTQRLSMVDLKQQCTYEFGYTPTIKRNKHNSSMDRQKKQCKLPQSVSNKSIGLSFSKKKSRKFTLNASAKQNKYSQHKIYQASLNFSIQRPTRKCNIERKNATLQLSFSQKDFYESHLKSLEKELEYIMECAVYSSKAGNFLQEFIFVEKLGEGTFSQVYLVFHKTTRSIFAMKVIKKQNIRSQCNFSRLFSEIKIQSFCNHPNITKLYSIFISQTSIYLLQQYAGKQTLYSAMLSHIPSTKNTTERVASYISQLCSAVSYLHQNSIIHRDIKPQNVLIAPGRVVKLADFGWSVYNPSKDLRKTFCGTPIYFSPQLLSAQQYDETVDIWAVGVLTYELLTGSNPFHINCFQQLNKIITAQVDLSKIKDQQAKRFVSELLVKERVLRKSMSNINRHPFLHPNTTFQILNE